MDTQQLKKVIFLDIDGVLNSVAYDRTRTEEDGNIDVSRLPLVKQIVDATGAGIVLSSSWRRHWSADGIDCDNIGIRLNNTFYRAGLTISDKTPDIPSRADAISAWLELHKETEAFVILDDEVFGWGDLASKLVRTNSRIGRGLEPHHVETAINILNGNEV